jgi:LDH2 family malate/lactate/ureidoglycolate dehydrogenase
LPLALALQRAQLYLSKRGKAQASAGRNQFEQQVSKAIASLKDTPRLDPNQPIYYPGELEAITREQRLQEGIPVPTPLIDDLAAYFGEDCVCKHFV